VVCTGLTIKTERVRKARFPRKVALLFRMAEELSRVVVVEIRCAGRSLDVGGA
jgi:hypothetical protein